MEQLKMNSNTPTAQPGNTQQPNANPTDLVGALNNIASRLSNGLQTVDRGALKDIPAMPTDTTIIVSSAAGVGARSIQANTYNEDYLNTTPTSNGSGGGSVVTTYSDEFNGNLISNILACKGDKGIITKQLQIKMVTISTGIQNPGAASGSAPILRTFNGDGSSADQKIPISTTGNPMYNQQGFLVINITYPIKRYAQLLFTVPADTQATVIAVYDYGM